MMIRLDSWLRRNYFTGLIGGESDVDISGWVEAVRTLSNDTTDQEDVMSTSGALAADAK